jgi:hypothetical protein
MGDVVGASVKASGTMIDASILRRRYSVSGIGAPQRDD